MEQKSVTLKIRPGITAVLCEDGGTYLIFDEPIQLVNFTAMEVAQMEDVRLCLMEEAQEELQAAFDAWAAPFLPPAGATPPPEPEVEPEPLIDEVPGWID